jgi:sulfur-carrier protein
MKIKIPPPLRKFTGGAETAEVSAQNLKQLFEGLESQFPGIRRAISNPDGTPQRFINIYVNDEDIRFLGGAGYTFREGDEILLIPAIAGGCGGPRARALLLYNPACLPFDFALRVPQGPERSRRARDPER